MRHRQACQATKRAKPACDAYAGALISHQQIKEPNVETQEGLKDYNLIRLFCIVKMYL